MRGIVIDPGQAPVIVSMMPSDSQQLESWMGGPFRLKPFGHVFAALAYTNSAGQALPCRHYAGRWYYGRLLLVGFKHNRITSLPPDLAQELAKNGKTPRYRNEQNFD